MKFPHIAKMIQTQDKRAKWVGSWSNYYSLWAVDGDLYVYDKHRWRAHLWEGITKHDRLYDCHPRRMTTDPRVLEQYKAKVGTEQESGA